MAVTGQAALLQTGRLLGQHTHSCSNHYIVLCIENTYVGNTHSRRPWRDTQTHTYNTYKHVCAGGLRVRRYDTWMANTHRHIHTSWSHSSSQTGGTSVHTCKHADITNKLTNTSGSFHFVFILRSPCWIPRIRPCLEPQPVFSTAFTSNHKSWFYIFGVFSPTAKARLIFPLVLKQVLGVKVRSAFVSITLL